MDAQQFLKAFGHVANAPGGINKLRELILSLAVTGRLVARDSAELPASDWLQTCDQTKAKLAAEKKISKPIQLMEITAAEIPFAPPPGWAFARLGRITTKIGSGSTPRGGSQAYVKKGIPFLRSQNIWNDGVRLDDVAYITPEINQNMSGTMVQPHDLLLNITGASLGRCAVVPADLGPANVNQHVTIIRLVDTTARQYLHLCLLSPLLQKMIWGRQVGMAREGLSKKVLEQFEIPIPPIEEQTRIVKRVGELMALCDQLEAQEHARHKLQNNLRQATLQAVSGANSPYELQTTWTRLAANFGRLFHAPKDVDDFIVELKNLAVRGLLETASLKPPELTAIKANCDALRTSYIESGLMRPQKIVAVAETDVIYPGHWAVAPFDEVAIVIGGVTKGRNLRERQTLTRPYLAVANVQRGFFKLDGLKTIEIAAEELEKYAVREGDLLITEGGDWDKVGRTAIWRGSVAGCVHQNHVFKARVPSEFLMNEWVELVFNSGVGRDYFAGASKQTTNLASISMAQLRAFPLPIPPLDEQRNLLKKLHSLTASALTWRQQLHRKQELAATLAIATVSTFTGIATVQPEEPMKAPQTELIALLRLGQTPSIKAEAPLATILTRHQGQMPAKDLWQRFGGEIDAFYAQLKTEIAHGWILEPAVAEVREVSAVAEGA
jgi:type I restriction enzyme S subunit